MFQQNNHHNSLESLKLYKSAINIASLAQKIDMKLLKPAAIYAELKEHHLRSEKDIAAEETRLPSSN